MAGQTKGFISNLLASAVWDAIKRGLGCSLVTALATALWEKLKHGSVDWYAISGMFVITLVVVMSIFRKGKKITLVDTAGSTSEQAPFNPLQDSMALGSLPVYLSSIRIEPPLDICEGWRLNGNYIFLNLIVVSAVSTGLLNAWIHIKTNAGNKYKGQRIAALSDWILVEHFFDPRFKMSNSRDIPLDTVSLSTHRLHGGLPEKGWIGFEIADVDIHGADGNLFKNISDLLIELEDGNGGRYRIELPSRSSWPTTENKIVHRELRQH